MFSVRCLFPRSLPVKLLSCGANFHLLSGLTVKNYSVPPLWYQLSRPLFGLIVRVATWVELRGCSAPDVPLTSARVSSWVHRVVVVTGKTSTYLKAHPICHPIPLPPSPLSKACAPLYSWRTEKDIPRSDATGTCYLSAHNFTKFVEYAPCRTGNCHLSSTLILRSTFIVFYSLWMSGYGSWPLY